MLDYVLLILGFGLVIKGADYFVEGASALSKKMNVSELVIGLTVVSFGTSAPELFVNVLASIQENSDIAVGNVLGSNIANILLILGTAAIVFPLSVTRGTIWKEIPLGLLAVVVVGILGNDRLLDNAGTSVLTRIDGLVLLCFFIIFVYYTFGIAKNVKGIDEHIPRKSYGYAKLALLMSGGLVCLVLGGRWIVNGAVTTAQTLGVSEAVIALTVVSVGTSLPELATSVVAARKGNSEIAVGNAVGSNIFNVFFVLAISSVIRPIPFQPARNLDVSAAVLASLLLFIWMFTGKRAVLDRWEGWVLVAIYAGYITLLVFLNI